METKIEKKYDSSAFEQCRLVAVSRFFQAYRTYLCQAEPSANTAGEPESRPTNFPCGCYNHRELLVFLQPVKDTIHEYESKRIRLRNNRSSHLWYESTLRAAALQRRDEPRFGSVFQVPAGHSAAGRDAQSPRQKPKAQTHRNTAARNTGPSGGALVAHAVSKLQLYGRGNRFDTPVRLPDNGGVDNDDGIQGEDYRPDDSLHSTGAVRHSASVPERAGRNARCHGHRTRVRVGALVCHLFSGGEPAVAERSRHPENHVLRTAFRHDALCRQTVHRNRTAAAAKVVHVGQPHSPRGISYGSIVLLHHQGHSIHRLHPDRHSGVAGTRHGDFLRHNRLR